MSESKNNFIYNINFNSSDLSNQLVKLLLFTNNYFKYNDENIFFKDRLIILIVNISNIF